MTMFIWFLIARTLRHLSHMMAAAPEDAADGIEVKRQYFYVYVDVL